MNATTTRRPKALLLDDDPTVLRLLGTALEAHGYDVRAAMDGATGLELLLDELLDLDVLVADVDLPGRDGPSLLHLLRHAGGERDLGVVLLAAGASPAAHARLLELGANTVVERAAGHRAALEAIRAVAERRAPRSGAWLEAARPAVRSALLLARAALGPAPRLAPSAA